MGRCIVAGGKPDMAAPVIGILASDLAVGSIVKLMENGVATEYLVVNQGKPSGSSLYDDSCDGLWLLRKDCYSSRAWDSSDNDYKNSDIHAWLNEDFFNLLGAVEQDAIKQVKIPYINGTGTSGSVASGSNGLTSTIFLLSASEINWTFTNDGACLSYFSGCKQEDSKRIAYLSGTATNWWTRSPVTTNSESVFLVFRTGGQSAPTSPTSCGIRPALILSNRAVFDAETLILKGVA